MLSNGRLACCGKFETATTQDATAFPLRSATPYSVIYTSVECVLETRFF